MNVVVAIVAATVVAAVLVGAALVRAAVVAMVLVVALMDAEEMFMAVVIADDARCWVDFCSIGSRRSDCCSCSDAAIIVTEALVEAVVIEVAVVIAAVWLLQDQ